MFVQKYHSVKQVHYEVVLRINHSLCGVTFNNAAVWGLLQCLRCGVQYSCHISQ